MSIKKTSPKFFLGAEIPNTKVLSSKIDEIIDVVNDLSDGSITTSSITPSTGTLVVTGDETISGDLTVETDASFEGTLSVDTISEFTATNGVAIDGVIVKDSTVALSDGTVSDLSVKLGADLNNGIYGISDTQMGFAVEGALKGGVDTNGLFTGVISEQTATVGVTIDSALVRDGFLVSKTTPVAINTTAVATAAQILSGYITSTSAAAVAITTPTATAIAAVIGAVRGTYFDLVIDNSVGANTVTLTLDASIAVVTPALTGGDTLTVSTANSVGIFRIVFISGTAAKIFRIG